MLTYNGKPAAHQVPKMTDEYLGEDLGGAGAGGATTNHGDAHLAVKIKLVCHLEVGCTARAEGTGPAQVDKVLAALLLPWPSLT